ncbi:MAG: GNAT family N-acetyltransferase [Clostridiaceae bacterium]|nr:GNAT family N-acetyltransferase [Clostridiaceae bacterium]
MNIKISKGSMENLEEIELLYNDLIDHLNEGINYPGWIKDVYPTKNDALKGIDENCLYIAKNESNKIVGSIILSHEPEEGYEKVTWNSPNDYNNIFVVRTFAVHPNYLKSGIGKMLLDFASDLALKSNVTSIRLDVYRKNLPAIRLYEKCGFTYIDTVDLGYSEYGLDLYKLYEKKL